MSMVDRPLSVPALAGRWRRALLRTPEAEDTRTSVIWLQGPALFADLRQPPDRPDFSHAAKLADLRHEDCQWLARQQGFAGTFAQADGVFWWHREIDLQPPSATPDAGALFWDGETLVETGHFADYLEHWQRVPTLPAPPCGALRLSREADSRAAILVRVGGTFMFARGRDPAIALSGATLAEAVAAAPDLATAQALLDCEISLGDAATWTITRSTLPYREGTIFTLAGWAITMREGECGL